LKRTRKSLEVVVEALVIVDVPSVRARIRHGYSSVRRRVLHFVVDGASNMLKEGTANM
jgi:hypothetical protein